MDKKTTGIILIVLGIAFAPVVLGIPLLIIGIINITQGEIELEKEKDNLVKNNKKISYEVNKLEKVCKFCKKEILESDKVVSYKKDKWDNTNISKAHSFCYKKCKGIKSHGLMIFVLSILIITTILLVCGVIFL